MYTLTTYTYKHMCIQVCRFVLGKYLTWIFGFAIPLSFFPYLSLILLYSVESIGIHILALLSIANSCTQLSITCYSHTKYNAKMPKFNVPKSKKKKPYSNLEFRTRNRSLKKRKTIEKKTRHIADSFTSSPRSPSHSHFTLCACRAL